MHASVNWISIVLMQITPQNELYNGICESSEIFMNSKEVRVESS